MLFRTHLALGVAVALYFLPHIEYNEVLFFAIVLLASMVPDLENGFTSMKKRKGGALLGKPNLLFHKNGLLHTYTVLVILAIIVALVWPRAAFPFFLGYSFHLFIDSFSQQGIRPFWPLKRRTVGRIAPGGNIDQGIFYALILVNFMLIVRLVF